MKKSRSEILFEVEDDIRRTERDLELKRWEREQLMRLLETDVREQQRYRLLRARIWYRAKSFLRRLARRFLNR